MLTPVSSLTRRLWWYFPQNIGERSSSRFIGSTAGIINHLSHALVSAQRESLSVTFAPGVRLLSADAHCDLRFFG